MELNGFALSLSKLVRACPRVLLTWRATGEELPPWLITGEEPLTLAQNRGLGMAFLHFCHPDRGVAEWRDLAHALIHSYIYTNESQRF